MELSCIKFIQISVGFSLIALVRKSEAIDRTCDAPLGMTTGAIFESQLSSSLPLTSLRGPEYARLHRKDGEGGWTASGQDSKQYLAIDLGSVGRITRVASQGRHNSQEWVTEYRLQYSNSSAGPYTTYSQNGVQTKFVGNSDSDSTKVNDVNPAIYARYIRFNPITKRNYFSMRVELYGCLAGSSVASFDGTNYISYNVQQKRYHIVQSSWNVTFRFRTTKPNGVIMSGYGTQGDYLVFQLVKGKLMVNVNLGSTADSAGDSSFTTGGLLDDNQWHIITYQRDKKSVQINLDSIHMHGHTLGSFSRLDLDREVTFGGTPDFNRPGIFTDEDSPGENFKGCLENMNYDGVFDVIGTVRDDTDNPRLSVHNGQTFSCTSEVMVPISFPTVQSRLIIENSEGGNLRTSFKFRTYATKGVLLYTELFTGEPFQILLNNAALQISIGDETNGFIIYSDGAVLNDGEWHSVEVMVEGSAVQFIVDDFRSNTVTTSVSPLSTYYIGSGEDDKLSQGFLGCMLDLTIGKFTVNFKSLTPAQNDGVEVDTCGLYDWCTPNPCEHNGICQATWDTFDCSCVDSYGGATCHRSTRKRSCDAVGRSSSISGSQLIDVDGSGPLKPFLVFCDFEDDKVWTELAHDSEDDIMVTGTELAGSYKHKVDYNGLNVDQIHMIVVDAEYCQQSIKYTCKKSRLLNSPDGPQYGWWVSSTGEKMDYWGGAGPGTRKCACGIEGTCVDESKWCNCDVYDLVEREDVGLITQKYYLPVSELRFGDISSPDSTGHHMLNPLRCHGKSYEPVTFRDEQAHLTFEIELTVESGFDVYLEFKTTTAQTVLFHAKHSTYEDFIKLELHDTREVLFSLNYGAGTKLLSVTTQYDLTDNMWHRVFVSMGVLEAYLEIDEANGVTETLPFGDIHIHFNLHRGVLFVGSTTSQTDGFLGCMRSLQMNGETKDMVTASKNAYYVEEGCIGHCDSRPCMNNGVCMEQYSTFSCDCDATPFEGVICTQEVGVDLGSGSDVTYSIPGQESLNSENDVIVVGFSTALKSPAHILRINGDGGASYMQVELIEAGALRFSFRFGSEQNTGEIVEDIGNYADGNHHIVKVSRNGNAVSMTIDETSPITEIFGSLSDTTFRSPDKILIGSPANSNGFIGCISRVQFNHILPLKMLSSTDRPTQIQTTGVVSESHCGVEGATLPPTTRDPYPDTTSYSTQPPVLPSVAAVKTAGDKASIAFVILTLFVALGIMLFIISRYMNRHEGRYRTNEDKGVAEAEDADEAVRASDPHQQGVRKKEWFL